MSFGKGTRKGVNTNEKYDTSVIEGNVEKPKTLKKISLKLMW